MKKLSPLSWFIAVLVLTASVSFTVVEHGVYVQLHPNNDKKVVVQIVPDKTYASVVVYINFYAADNKRVAQQAYSLCDEKDKYVRKDQVTEREFKFSFDRKVTRVTIDHVSEGEVLEGKDAKKGVKINLPALDHAPAAIGK